MPATLHAAFDITLPNVSIGLTATFLDTSVMTAYASRCHPSIGSIGTGTGLDPEDDAIIP